MYRKNYFRFVILIFIFTFFCGCATEPITMQQTNPIKKGFTDEEVNALLKRKPDNDFIVKYNSEDYLVQSFQMVTGSTYQTQTTYLYSKPVLIPVTIGVDVPTIDNFYFLYDENSRLVYWGFLADFAKEQDDLLREIHQRIIEKIKESEEALERQKIIEKEKEALERITSGS